MSWNYCPECLKRQRRINDLEEEIQHLKGRLRHQERTAAEGAFGSSTPSSKIPIKPDSLPERQARRGGAKKGHKGHGRAAFSPQEAQREELVCVCGDCPDCGTPLISKGIRQRSVLECRPVVVEKVIYRLERKYCPRCRKYVQAQVAGVMPKSQYANSLLSHLATEHYQHGVTLGRLEEQLGVGCGGLIDALHKLARLLKSASEALVKEYRQEKVKHADETGWRFDGANGYAWLFCSQKTSVFRFRKSRSAAVAQEGLGKDPLTGVLVVDRYSSYNRVPCRIQYCYAHLLRDLKDIEKDFPGNCEVAAFVKTLHPLLAGAMSLRGLGLSKRQFRLQADRIKRRIIAEVHRGANHPAIQGFQDIFRQKAGRLYHWARDPDIPADNNLAERELRPLVIARKISFGSQSDEGANTREVLMTIVRTLAKRLDNPYIALKRCLDRLAVDPLADPFPILFPNSSRD